MLTLWRGVDVAPLEIARTLRARKAGDLLPKVLADLRMDSRQSEAEILKVWNTSLPEDVTKHAQPTGIRRGTLFISVDSNAWMSEIMRWRRKEIIERLRHSFGPELVQKLAFRVG